MTDSCFFITDCQAGIISRGAGLRRSRRAPCILLPSARSQGTFMSSVLNEALLTPSTRLTVPHLQLDQSSLQGEFKALLWKRRDAYYLLSHCRSNQSRSLQLCYTRHPCTISNESLSCPIFDLDLDEKRSLNAEPSSGASVFGQI